MIKLFGAVVVAISVVLAVVALLLAIPEPGQEPERDEHEDI